MSSKVRSFFWCDFVLFLSWNVVGFSVDIQTKMNVHKMFLRCLRRQMNIIKSNNSLVHWVHISKTASKTIWNVIVTVTAKVAYRFALYPRMLEWNYLDLVLIVHGKILAHEQIHVWWLFLLNSYLPGITLECVLFFQWNWNICKKKQNNSLGKAYWSCF